MQDRKILSQSTHTLSSIGHIYADLMMIAFGRASYLFGIISLVILIKKEYQNRSNIFLQTLFLIIL